MHSTYVMRRAIGRRTGGVLAALLLLVAATAVSHAAVDLTNVRGKAERRTDPGSGREEVWMVITYNVADVPADGAVVRMSVTMTPDTGDALYLKPSNDELTGDVGSITGDGAKKIEWPVERALVRMGKEGRYHCRVDLLVEGKNGLTSATLNVASYVPSGWSYFNPGTAIIQNLQRTNAFTPACGPVQGANWQETVEQGAVFYKGEVLMIPSWRGRRQNDVMKGTPIGSGCSAFLAVKGQGTANEKVWVNFAQKMQMTVDADRNGTPEETFQWEFQFRYFGKKIDGTKALKAGNAGKPDVTDSWIEWSQGADFSLDLIAPPEDQESSDLFDVEVELRSYRHSYGGSHVMTFTAEGDAHFTRSGSTLSLSGGSMKVNNWLSFNGDFSIDTTTDRASFTSNGTWRTAEDQILHTGSYGGTLKDAIGFSSSAGVLPVAVGLWSLGGVAVALENIRFLGGPDQATGITMDVRLLVRELATGCKFELAQPLAGLGSIAGIELKGVKLAADGLDIAGVQVNNAGFTVDPELCLKNLTITNDRQQRKVTADVTASSWFFDEMGGGFTLLENKLESFHLLMKTQGKFGVIVPIPSPATWVAVWTGFDCGVSNIQSGPLTISGTVFFSSREDWKLVPGFARIAQLVPIADVKLFEIDGTISGSVSGDNSISGKLRFLGKGDVWVVQGRVKADMTGNSSTLRFGLEGGFDVVNLGGDQWLFAGTGRGSATFVPAFNLTESMTGNVYIPDLFKNNAVFSAINKHLGLPYRLASVKALLNNTTLSFDGTFPLLGTIGIVADLSRSPITEPHQFIRVTNGSVIPPGMPSKRKGASILGVDDTTYRTIATAPGMARAIIQLWGAPSAPASFLVDPAGTRISGTTDDSSVVYLPPTPQDGSALWVIRNPAAGTWKLATIGEKAGDSVTIWGLRDTRGSFQFTSRSDGRTVTVEWDRTGAPAESTVDFYLDADNREYDGIYVGSAAETAGSFTYTLSDSLPECGYYIHATRNDNGVLSTAYSTTYHANPKSWLAAPGNIHAEYLPSGEVTVTWEGSTDPNALGYVVRVTDESGHDSVLATVAHTYTMAQLHLDAPATKHISIMTTGEHNMHGCWSEPVALVVAGVEEDEPVTGGRAGDGVELHIMPQPVANRASIFINLDRPATLGIDLYDIEGRKVLTLKEGRFEQGTVRADVDLSTLPNGIYIVRVGGGDINASRRIVVQR